MPTSGWADVLKDPVTYTRCWPMPITVQAAPGSRWRVCSVLATRVPTPPPTTSRCSTPRWRSCPSRGARPMSTGIWRCWYAPTPPVPSSRTNAGHMQRGDRRSTSGCISDLLHLFVIRPVQVPRRALLVRPGWLGWLPQEPTDVIGDVAPDDVLPSDNARRGNASTQVRVGMSDRWSLISGRPR